MKIVKRLGVFETNSSSTHTLTLVSKADYEADKATEKPKYRKYGVVATKEDKLLMACGCCYEIYEDSPPSRWRPSSCDRAIGWMVRAYCDLTGEDYDKTLAFVNATNHSGRACHMKFFSEGALYDADSDYRIIDDLLDHTKAKMTENMRRYFDDEVVLLYREYYAGVGWGDD